MCSPSACGFGDFSRNRTFYRYIQQVFSFQQHTHTLNDHRIAPDIQTESMFEAVFLCLVLRLGSFRALAFEMTHRQAQKVFRRPADFCINTLRYGLEQFEIEPLEMMLFSIMKQIKRSKMISDTICGYHVAAIDGTEYYRSEAICCSDCMTVHLKDGTTHAVHRAVLLQHVGALFKPFIKSHVALFLRGAVNLDRVQEFFHLQPEARRCHLIE